MFFRKPMRLEKWIAFDGAIGAEVLAAAAEQSDDAGSDVDVAAEHLLDMAEESQTSPADVADAASPFDISFSGGISLFTSGDPETNTIKFDVDGDSTYDAELTLPIGMKVPDGHDGSGYLPFGPASGAEVDFDMKSCLRAEEFFIEIGKPQNGEFFFFTNPNWGGHSSIAAFVAKHGLRTGDYVALQTQSYPDGSIELMMARVQNAGTGYDSFAHQTPSFRIFKTDTGGLRIGIYNNAVGGAVTGEMVVESIFRSLAFRPDSGATDAGSFQISIYYKTGQNLWSDGGSLLNDSANTIFNPVTNPPIGVIEDASKPCDENGSVIGGEEPEDPGPEDPGPEDPGPEDPGPEDPGPEDPGPEDPGPEDPGPEDPGPETPEVPGPDEPGEPETPEPEDPVQPTLPPELPPPVVDTGSDSGNDSDSAGGDADSGATPDSGGESALAGDGATYIHRNEDGEEGSEEDEDVEEVLVLRDEGPQEDGSEAGAAAAAESALAAMGMELLRDAEHWFQIVRGDRFELEKALGRLRDSYFGLAAGDKEIVQSFLRNLFESGNRELDAVNRILRQMHAQIGEYQKAVPTRRDGMMFESIRELLDSAARRSGESGALSTAVNAVCVFLEQKQGSGERLAGVGELSGRFDDAFAAAIAKWERTAERNDPMGRDLARNASLHGQGPAAK